MRSLINSRAESTGSGDWPSAVPPMGNRLGSLIPAARGSGRQQLRRDFDHRLGRYLTACTALWRAPTGTSWGPLVAPEEKAAREASADRYRARMESLVQQLPASSVKREAWRTRLLDELREAARECLGFPAGGLDLLFTPRAIEAADEFIRQAKVFDPGITDESLLQAIRNLWVIHGLQLLLEQEIALTPAGFAYSMLYPCTDNYLDDSAISPEAKLRFGRWLGERLDGDHCGPPGPHAVQIDRLIGMIEGGYPRAEYPDVYRSLLAIHEAQIKSLTQHQPSADCQEGDLLAISIRKGGTSVLADGFLVTGHLDEDEGEFMFNYGVLLQLMDDLQDLKADLDHQHCTLFTRQTVRGPLDDLTSDLWSFTNAVLSGTTRFAAARFDPLKRLIQENCRLLLFHAVAANQMRYTPGFVRKLEASSPFRFAYLTQQEQSLGNSYKRLVGVLKSRFKAVDRAMGTGKRHGNAALQDASCTMEITGQRLPSWTAAVPCRFPPAVR